MTPLNDRSRREASTALHLSESRSPKARLMLASNPSLKTANPISLIQAAARDVNACFSPDELELVHRCLRDNGIFVHNKGTDLQISDREASAIKGMVFKPPKVKKGAKHP